MKCGDIELRRFDQSLHHSPFLCSVVVFFVVTMVFFVAMTFVSFFMAMALMSFFIAMTFMSFFMTMTSIGAGTTMGMAWHM